MHSLHILPVSITVRARATFMCWKGHLKVTSSSYSYQQINSTHDCYSQHNLHLQTYLWHCWCTIKPNKTQSPFRTWQESNMHSFVSLVTAEFHELPALSTKVDKKINVKISIYRHFHLLQRCHLSLQRKVIQLWTTLWETPFAFPGIWSVSRLLLLVLPRNYLGLMYGTLETLEEIHGHVCLYC